MAFVVGVLEIYAIHDSHPAFQLPVPLSAAAIVFVKLSVTPPLFPNIAYLGLRELGCLVSYIVLLLIPL